MKQNLLLLLPSCYSNSIKLNNLTSILILNQWISEQLRKNYKYSSVVYC